MKEINEAYDQIMNERSGRASSAGGYGQQGYQGYGQQSRQAYQQGTPGSMYGQIRSAINAGNLNLAEELLQRTSQRDAEWFS